LATEVGSTFFSCVAGSGMAAVVFIFAMLVCDVAVTRAGAIGVDVLERKWQQDPAGS
jgi:hypothetical protein